MFLLHVKSFLITHSHSRSERERKREGEREVLDQAESLRLFWFALKSRQRFCEELRSDNPHTTLTHTHTHGHGLTLRAYCACHCDSQFVMVVCLVICKYVHHTYSPHKPTTSLTHSAALMCI